MPMYVSLTKEARGRVLILIKEGKRRNPNLPSTDSRKHRDIVFYNKSKFLALAHYAGYVRGELRKNYRGDICEKLRVCIREARQALSDVEEEDQSTLYCKIILLWAETENSISSRQFQIAQNLIEEAIEIFNFLLKGGWFEIKEHKYRYMLLAKLYIDKA